MQGVKFEITGDSDRGRVSTYHYKPHPLALNKTKFRIDVAGLKKVEQRTAVSFDGSEYYSKYTIGMEIEKNTLHRGAVKEYELFCGFEYDGSCGVADGVKGYEAVTHILPLLPESNWRMKVYDMMHKAEKIIDDRFSPSNARNYSGQYKCGGHITIGVDGLDGDEIREAMRKHCGIILALFRHRLKVDFCNHNQTMLGRHVPYNDYRGGWSDKYQVALVKRNCLEFRIPSKFESVKQMMRRYELFYELVKFSIETPNGSHEKLMKKLRPIILGLYEGNNEKTNEVIRLAAHFREFILTSTIHQDISKWAK